MSKTPIPQKVKAELWWKSAGRCEFKGCNKPLDKHGITMDNCNLSNCAHIIADSPDGPRGNDILSSQLAKDTKNIMLMCPECHKYIDGEGKDKYNAECLFAMKKHHEDRMRFLTGLKEDTQAHIVTFGSKIGDQTPGFSFQELQDALLPDFYPAEDHVIDLGGKWFSGSNWNEYWQREIENLENNCKEMVLDHYNRWEHKRIALFGFAPMPSLVKLGTMLNNKHDVIVYQKHRKNGWAWSLLDAHIDYLVERPKTVGNQPALILSLSFPIGGRVRNILKDNASIWEMTIKDPNPDFLISKSMLYDYGRQIEGILDEISKASDGQTLDLFLSVPVACAIEFGRVWMHKANMQLNVFDYDRRYSEKDKLAVIINKL